MDNMRTFPKLKKDLKLNIERGHHLPGEYWTIKTKPKILVKSLNFKEKGNILSISRKRVCDL